MKLLNYPGLCCPHLCAAEVAWREVGGHWEVVDVPYHSVVNNGGEGK